MMPIIVRIYAMQLFIKIRYLLSGFACLLMSNPVFAQESAMSSIALKKVEMTEGAETAEGLAKKLSNPIASLISVPFQYNYDQSIGIDDEGAKSLLNIQPVIPVDISENWNMISRTILPLISQKDVYPGAGSQSGIGDTVQSLFFSPKALTENGWTWGAGPVFLLPTGSDDALTADVWGLGPTGVALKQSGPWTGGGLVNHIWSKDETAAGRIVNATFIQPFLSYTTPGAITYTVNSESTYNWNSEEWSVPVNFIVNKMRRFGNQMVSFGVGARYYAESTTSGPEGWGGRFMVTLLYPK